MAASGKQIFSKLIHSISRNNVLLSSENKFRLHISVVYCSTSSENSKTKLSKAMKAYIKRNIEYDNFLKEQMQEYDMGKKFLASMMGKNAEMTQKDVDEAIEYLFPSGLYVPKARPMMKPPGDIFLKQKPLMFDNSGRPFHVLFYTGRQNYSQCLHDAATHYQKLDDHEIKMRKSGKENPEKKLVLVGNWITKEDLEKQLLEKLYTIEYTKLIEVLNRLSEHPYAFMAEDFIMKFWIPASVPEDSEIPKPETLEDGTQIIEIKLSQRKTSLADVKIIYPGKGQIKINNLGLDYFSDMQAREQSAPDLIDKFHCTEFRIAYLRRSIPS